MNKLEILQSNTQAWTDIVYKQNGILKNHKTARRLTTEIYHFKTKN